MAEQEKKLAGASYIISWFSDIENLIWYGSVYQNLMVELKQKYVKKVRTTDGKETFDMEKVNMDEDDENRVMTTVQTLRSMVFKTYVKFKALRGQIKELGDQDTRITASYKSLSVLPTPDMSAIEDYIINVNEVFVAGVVGELLLKSKDIINTFGG